MLKMSVCKILHTQNPMYSAHQTSDPPSICSNGQTGQTRLGLPPGIFQRGAESSDGGVKIGF